MQNHITEDPPLEPVPASSAQPLSQGPRSIPPPLPPASGGISAARAAADAAFADRMFERLAASDYVGALLTAEALLVNQPSNADAIACATMAGSELRKLYVSRLGSLDRTPRLKVAPNGLLALQLDFREGFLLSRIEQSLSLADLIVDCGFPELDALRILSELYLRRIITLEDSTAALAEGEGEERHDETPGTGTSTDGDGHEDSRTFM